MANNKGKTNFTNFYNLDTTFNVYYSRKKLGNPPPIDLSVGSTTLTLERSLRGKGDLPRANSKSLFIIKEDSISNCLRNAG